MKPRHIAFGALTILALVAIAVLLVVPRMRPMPAPTPQPTPSSSIAANGYEFGYSTYYVATRRNVPRNWGNAATWYQNAQHDGYQVGTTPKKGAIAWTDAGPYGDVAYVVDVTADGTKVRVSSMNYNAWNKVTYRVVAPTAFKGYIY